MASLPAAKGDAEWECLTEALYFEARGEPEKGQKAVARVNTSLGRLDGQIADAIETSLQLARREGIFTGISGGAAFRAALDVAERAPKGTSVLAILADTGERYLSSPLFADIQADMNEEELELSRSTPNHQFKE